MLKTHLIIEQFIKVFSYGGLKKYGPYTSSRKEGKIRVDTAWNGKGCVDQVRLCAGRGLPQRPGVILPPVQTGKNWEAKHGADPL